MRQGVLIVVLLAVLAGCGEESSPPLPVVTSSVPVPSASAAPSGAPELPPAAKANTKAGAIAFVRHYLRIANSALTTGSTAALRGLGSPESDACNRFVEYVDRTYASGGSILGGTCTAVDVGAIALDKKNWQVGAPCTYAAQTVVAADGQETRTPGAESALVFGVQFDKTFRVTSWSRM